MKHEILKALNSKTSPVAEDDLWAFDGDDYVMAIFFKDHGAVRMKFFCKDKNNKDMDQIYVDIEYPRDCDSKTMIGVIEKCKKYLK